MFVARTPDLERRQELLDRIVVYVAENGLAQATLRPMAAALEVSINRLVHHFGSKEELLTAAVARGIEQQLAVQEAWLVRTPEIGQVALYRKWWKWMNSSPANLALVRLNYEAATLDTKITGLARNVRADQIGVWRHDVEKRLEMEGMSHARAVAEASLSKATFTGLVMDLFGSGDRKRLTAAMESFLQRLELRIAGHTLT